MAERSKAADCKSVGNYHVGSNPTPLNIVFSDNRYLNRHLKHYHIYGVKLRNVVRRMKILYPRVSYIPETLNLLKTYRVSFSIHYPRFQIRWTNTLLRHRHNKVLFFLLSRLHKTCFYERTFLTVWDNLNNLKVLFNRYTYRQF